MVETIEHQVVFRPSVLLVADMPGDEIRRGPYAPDMIDKPVYRIRRSGKLKIRTSGDDAHTMPGGDGAVVGESDTRSLAVAVRFSIPWLYRLTPIHRTLVLFRKIPRLGSNECETAIGKLREYGIRLCDIFGFVRTCSFPTAQCSDYREHELAVTVQAMIPDLAFHGIRRHGRKFPECRRGVFHSLPRCIAEGYVNVISPIGKSADREREIHMERDGRKRFFSHNLP